jgi:SAM-dependent methyltransferase
MEMARSFGMEVAALDLAFGIEQAYKVNDSPFVHFMQGSVLDLPFRRAFDCVYCAGVLVAVPDPRAGFRSIIQTLRRNGRCFIWMYHPIDRKYHPGDYHKLVLYDFLRTRLTSRLPIRIQRLLYLSVLPPFLLKQELDLLLGRKESRLTWREKVQDLVDFFSPVYQHRYSPEEIVEWFHEEGFDNVEVAYTEEYGFGVRGDLVSPKEENRPEALAASQLS